MSRPSDTNSAGVPRRNTVLLGPSRQNTHRALSQLEDRVAATEAKAGKDGKAGKDATLSPELLAALDRIAVQTAVVATVTDAFTVTITPTGLASTVPALNGTGEGLSVGDVVVWSFRMGTTDAVVVSAMVRNLRTDFLTGPFVYGMRPFLDTGGLLGAGQDAWYGWPQWDGGQWRFSRAAAMVLPDPVRHTDRIIFDGQVYGIYGGSSPERLDPDGIWRAVLTTDGTGISQSQGNSGMAVAGGRLWVAGYDNKLYSLGRDDTAFTAHDISWDPAPGYAGQPAPGQGVFRLLGNGSSLWLHIDRINGWGDVHVADVTEVTAAVSTRLVPGTAGGVIPYAVYNNAVCVDALGHLLVATPSDASTPAYLKYLSAAGAFSSVPLLTGLQPYRVAAAADGSAYIGGLIPGKFVMRMDLGDAMVPAIVRVSPTGGASLVWVGQYAGDWFNGLEVDDTSRTLSWLAYKTGAYWAALPA